MYTSCTKCQPGTQVVAAPTDATSTSPDSYTPQSPKILRSRISSVVKWALPITTLALVPKCPACIAGYALMFTGIGVSLSTADAIRVSLISGCIGAIVILLFRTTTRRLWFVK